jgi:hypothetical protein
VYAVFRELLVNLAASVVADLSSPTGMIGYVFGIGLIAYWTIGWHRKQIPQGKRGVDSWYFIALSFLVATVAIGAGAYGLGLRSAPQVGIAKSSAAPTNPSAATSVLNSNRFYSAQNKEEVSGRLDRISEEINKADKEILLPTIQVLLPRFLLRPVSEARQNLEKLDGIEAASKRMDASLYNDLLANERDYRVEINAFLFPKEPFVNFMLAAHAYRNSIEVWMKLADNVPDAETGQELRDTVSASARSFGTARDEFLKWLTAKQDLISKTRRDLRS